MPSTVLSAKPVRFPNRTISVNFRRDNRHDPEAGRFGFPTEPDFTQKP